MQPSPVHMPGDVRQIEFPPVKGSAFEVKMQVSVLLAMQGYGAIDVSRWRRPELVVFDSFDYVRTDGSRDDHRLGGAKPIGHVN